MLSSYYLVLPSMPEALDANGKLVASNHAAIQGSNTRNAAGGAGSTQILL